MDHETVVTAPSVLSADFSDIAGALRTIEDAGGDWIHLDVMDGSFVPNLTFGPKMVADIRKRTSLPLDTHLMIDAPERSIEHYAQAGADHLTFHIESTVHAHRLVQQIQELNIKPGVALVPSTPLSAVEELLGDLFQVLIMTVNPGFGGQRLIPETVEKVRRLARIKKERGLRFRIAVDGGVNALTSARVREAGASVLVSGSAFFQSNAPAQELLLLRGQQSA